MRTTEDDEDESDSSSTGTGRPAWMTILRGQAEEWLKTLPEELTTSPITDSPLARYFAREGSTGRSLLTRIHSDLRDLIQVCEGHLKQTNELRALMSELNKGKSRLGLQSQC
jgi:dynein heavy chain 1